MPIRNATAVPFIPVGISDAIDMASAFPGACQILQNVTFSRSNRGALIPRPGVSIATVFAGFSSPAVISVAVSSGIFIYGMIGTARTIGFDEPFCYNTATGTFVAVSGVTGANVPTTQSSSGAWTPPTMDIIGTKVIVTHPGFSGSNFIGAFDVSNPASPAWSAGNTATNALPSVPLAVIQFGGRAYYFCGNVAYFSDVLVATSISNANFAGALTLGDTSSVVCVAGLPVNTSSVGIIQAIIVFKPNSVWQIIGDIANTSGSGNQQPLALNQISKNAGCTMPRSAQTTPNGVYYISSDGPRQITIASQIEYLKSDGLDAPMLSAPFAMATTPSRVCAAYNNGIYRVGFDLVMNQWIYNFTSVDYWYDVMFEEWNGPHSFPYHLAISAGKTFYLASNNFPGILFVSDPVPSTTTTYVDNAASYNCIMVSANMEGAPMTESAIVESTVELSRTTSTISYYLLAYDSSNNPLSAATVTLAGASSLWGTAKWGQFVWNSGAVSNKVCTIPWTNPIVAKKWVLSATAPATAGFSIRGWMLGVQSLGYVNK